ncbi:MAG: hypothetical protein SFZ24_06200 [Planctomycetota bacterium]|nr:hypothetical protein [Planctomycetota bacterium]
MNPVLAALQSAPTLPPRAGADSSAWNSLGGAIAIAAVAGGVALLVFWWRTRRPALPRTTNPAAADADVRTLERDMRELTDCLAGELDARAARLESLIEAADARLAALESASRHAAITGERRPPAAALPQPDAPDPFAEVYDLADQGFQSVDIARRTGRPTGQIDLILNLRRGSVAL